MVDLARPPGDYLDRSKLPFNYTISGTSVRIETGDLLHGTKLFEVNFGVHTIIPITADHQYVWVEYTAGTTPEIKGPSTVKPIGEQPNIYRIWLYQFRLNGYGDSAFVELEKVGHVGNIEILGVYA